jgi:hypothetical protein
VMRQSVCARPRLSNYQHAVRVNFMPNGARASIFHALLIFNTSLVVACSSASGRSLGGEQYCMFHRSELARVKGLASLVYYQLVGLRLA